MVIHALFGFKQVCTFRQFGFPFTQKNKMFVRIIE